MVTVFRAVRRVLRDDGTLWLNLGDSYNTSPAGNKIPSGFSQIGRKRDNNLSEYNTQEKRFPGLKPKDLCMIPARVALALQADGWWLRSDIIWAKPNPMPESVTDRPTKSYEHVFLLSKKAKYYYDADAVREPYSDSYLNDPRHETGSTDKNMKDGYDDALAQNPKKLHKMFDKPVGNGRNLRDVWTIATQPCRFAHFATFPEELVNKCILMGTADRACGICGAPWVRDIVRTEEETENNKGSYFDKGKTAARDGGDRTQSGARYKLQTIGFRSSCDHDDDSGRCIVLDPFGGTGTVAYRAQEMGRQFIHIDISEKYNEYARKRLSQGVIL